MGCNMNNFLHYQPTRIHFGLGESEHVGEIAKKYGSRCLLITPEPIEILKPLFSHVKELLEEQGIQVAVYDKVQPNPTSDAVEEAVRLGYEHHVEFVVGLGGGSAIDTAKMVAYNAKKGICDWEGFFAVRSGFQDDSIVNEDALPMIAISTTSGTGSQCTQAAVITNVENHQKTTVFRQEFFPKEAIVDPQLMATLPYGMSASTAFDAFCHLSESYLMGRLSPISEPIAIAGMQMVIDTLPKLREEAKIAYREVLAAADTMAGICLSNGGGTMLHFLGEILTSCNTRINHGNSLAIVYPKFIGEYFLDEVYHDRLAFILHLIEPNTNCKDAQCAQAVMEGFLTKVGLCFTASNFDTSVAQWADIMNTVQHQKRFDDTSRLVRVMEACR